VAADCDWCEGTLFVSLWHRKYDGGEWVYLDAPDPKTGEIAPRRYPGRITVHCVHCDLGRWQWSKLDIRDQDRLWNSKKYEATPHGYLPTDPTYEPQFSSFDEAIAWMKTLGKPGKSIAGTFPPLPRASRRLTPMDVANQLRERSQRENREPAA
jgi:hypothetical protein